MNIRPSANIRQNYNEIATLCHETMEPVFLTKNGEGDLVVISIEAYNQREASLDLREKLLEAEEQLAAGVKPVPLDEAAAKWRARVDAIHAR